MRAPSSSSFRHAVPFHHQAPGALVYGPGAAKTTCAQGPLKKAARVLVVTDRGVRAAGLLDRVLEGLGERAALVDDQVVPDADVAHVDALAARAKEAAVDAVLAVGGGSVMDSAKGVAAVLATGRPVAAMEGVAKVRAKLPPLVCVPTTAGTGAEATQFMVLMDRGAGVKRVYADASLVPAQGVLDPEMVLGLPRAITAATGVDALTHAIEALASKMRHPFGAASAVEACRLILVERALQRSLDDGADPSARGAMLVAAALAGQAISTSMLGACHAFAHALGAYKGIPHGVANGLFLVPVMRLNAPKAGAAYAALGRVLGATGDDEALARAAIDEVERVVHDVAGIPASLRALDLGEADVEPLADLVMADPDLSTNPVPVDRAVVLAALRARL